MRERKKCLVEQPNIRTPSPVLRSSLNSPIYMQDEHLANGLLPQYSCCFLPDCVSIDVMHSTWDTGKSRGLDRQLPQA